MNTSCKTFLFATWLMFAVSPVTAADSIKLLVKSSTSTSTPAKQHKHIVKKVTWVKPVTGQRETRATRAQRVERANRAARVARHARIKAAKLKALKAAKPKNMPKKLDVVKTHKQPVKKILSKQSVKVIKKTPAKPVRVLKVPNHS